MNTFKWESSTKNSAYIYSSSAQIHMKLSNLWFLISILLILSCGGKTGTTDDESLSKEADKIESESNLSSACEKDLKKYASFLDDAKVMIKKHAQGTKMSKADQEEWNEKTKDLMKEFSTSAGAMTNPDCAVAFSKIQGEFTQVMMQLAQAQ